MRARFSFSACSFTATYPPRRMEGEREGGHGSILLPARDETKGKLTSAQWFSLLSRNCFSKFVSYRWKRTEVELSSFFSFFLFFFNERKEEGKGKGEGSANSFFPNRVPLKLDYDERISIWWPLASGDSNEFERRGAALPFWISCKTKQHSIPHLSSIVRTNVARYYY